MTRLRRVFGSRAAAAAAAVIVTVAVLAWVSPGVESLPGSVPAADVPPPDEDVRVVHDGRTLVYDKRRGWAAAKAAEWFPNVVPSFVPADFVADENGVLFESRVRLRTGRGGSSAAEGAPGAGDESPARGATAE